jgi:hypothetical protein
MKKVAAGTENDVELTQMVKCVSCGTETGFNWPPEPAGMLMRRLWKGPVCKLCSTGSTAESFEGILTEEMRASFYALKRRESPVGPESQFKVSPELRKELAGLDNELDRILDREDSL